MKVRIIKNKKIKNKEETKNPKNLAKEFSIRVGATALAILAAISERFLDFGNVRFNPKTFNQMLNDLSKFKTVYEHYDDYIKVLKGLKGNTAKVSLWRLRQKGLIEDAKVGYILTSLGEKVLVYARGDSNYKWDGKYRIAMFDIPESLRRERNWFRIQLRILNYFLLQKSVFIGKRPLPEEILKEMKDKKIDKFVRLLTVGEIDDDKWLHIINDRQ